MKVSVIAGSVVEAREAAKAKLPGSPLYVSTISYVVDRPKRAWPGDPLPDGRRRLGVREFVFTTELNP